MSDIVYQSKQKLAKISSHSFDINFLKKLFNIICEINKEAAQLAVLDLKPTKPEQEFEDFKKVIHDLYKVEAHIWDTKGNYIVLDSEAMFDEHRLPSDIAQIRIDNTTYYKVHFNNIDPAFKIIIQFDFSKSSIFDLLSNPSLTTANNNFINIFGTKETWVSGAYEKIVSSLKDKETKRAWLYQNSVYDLILWFLFMPFVFLNLFKYDDFLIKLIGSKSIPFEILLYLFGILLILFLFRILFNYAKWVFPYTELITSSHNKSATHRKILYTLVIFIVGAINPWLQDLVKSIVINYFSHLFK